MEFLSYLLLAGFGFFIASKMYEGFKAGAVGDDGTRHCMTCGIEAIPKTHVRGSFLVELVLWLCLIVPGLIYSVWRISSKQQVCPSCDSTTLVPVDSPAAINQRKNLQS